MSSEVLVGWSNGFTKPLTLHLYNIRIRWATLDSFYNILKPTIQHSHSLHAVIGQVCNGEKVSRVSTSHSSSPFSVV